MTDRRDRLIRTMVSGVFPVLMVVAILITAIVMHGREVRSVSFDSFFLTIVACGAGAMIIIETMKRMLPLRGAFQRRQVHMFLDHQSQYISKLEIDASTKLRSEARWENSPSNSVAAPPDPPLPTGFAERLKGAVLMLETSSELKWSSIDSAFNLPAEQLVAQLNVALGALPRETDSNKDTSTRESAVYNSAGLDQLQIRLAARWRHYVQATAIWLSGLLALVWAGIGESQITGFSVAGALIFGGFVAWTARDVTAAIESWRK